jgi:hypothetical protein
MNAFIVTELGRATFWAIFSQTHLVTLLALPLLECCFQHFLSPRKTKLPAMPFLHLDFQAAKG